jgi:class 3 adenylate cyclase/tetratricopeptide (TPR) repeat protein
LDCSFCGHDNRENALFCEACGRSLTIVCVACGAAPRPTANFCDACGGPLEGHRTGAEPREEISGDAAAEGSEAPTEAHEEFAGEAPAERRQLTVLFCDLAESTRISQALDPEDLRTIVRSYQDAVSAAVSRYEGHIAQYLGDGILVYFGYPRAHEDDAQRAVRAGLEFLSELSRVNERLASSHGLRLAARVGIHTGTVVVGEMGGGARRETLAMGSTANIASRLEQAAAPNSVVISAATQRLVRGLFVIEELEPQQLHGVAEPVVSYRVLQPSGIESRLDIEGARATPFVGRDHELGLLLDGWEQIQEGDGQTFLISGEPGLGKSRLVQTLRERMADEPHTWLESRCSAYTKDTAFHPVIETVRQGLGIRANDTPEEELRKLEGGLEGSGFALDEAVPIFAAFLSIPCSDAYPPLQISPELQRRKTIDALAAWCLALGELQPVLIFLEDLHWCDPSTLELIGKLIEQTPTTRIMTVLTARQEFQAPWAARSNLTSVVLRRLRRRKAREMVVYQCPDRALPEDVIDAILDRAEGNPLFVEEIAKMVLESGLLVERGDRFELSGSTADFAIPETLQDSLMARIDRLSAAKEVAQLAAAIGREFSYALLAKVVDCDAGTLHSGLARLIETELLFQRGEPPDAAYTFKHSLIQETAYQSLLKRERRRIHRNIAETLEAHFPEKVEAEPAVVAHHCEEGGLMERAVELYQRSGESAAARYAGEEAATHFGRALRVVETLPETPQRNEREFALQVALGAELKTIRGFASPETRAAFNRARSLCDDVADTPETAITLFGLAISNLSGGSVAAAFELGEGMVASGQRSGDPLCLTLAYNLLASSQFFQGRFRASADAARLGIEVCDSTARFAAIARTGQDAFVAYHDLLGWSLLALGLPDEAWAASAKGVELAREAKQPFSLANSLIYAATSRWSIRARGAAAALASEAIDVSRSQGFPLWEGVGRVILGWATIEEEGAAKALEQVHGGIALASGSGNSVGTQMMLDALASVHSAAGNTGEALGAVEAALGVSRETGTPFWDANLQRRKAELLLASDPSRGEEALQLFREAVDIARKQEARWFELRATTGLARLLRRQGRIEEGRDLLVRIVESISQGFDMPDWREARALLDEIS